MPDDLRIEDSRL